MGWWIRQVAPATIIHHWLPFILVFETLLAWSTRPTNSFLMRLALIFPILIVFRFSSISSLAQAHQLALSIEAPFPNQFTFLIISYLSLACQTFICIPPFQHWLYSLWFQAQQLRFALTLTRSWEYSVSSTLFLICRLRICNQLSQAYFSVRQSKFTASSFQIQADFSLLWNVFLYWSLLLPWWRVIC